MQSKISLLIAIVSHTRRPDFAMLMSVFDTLASLKSRGHDVNLTMHVGDADLGSARNLVFGAAYTGPYTHLLCVDADVSWPPGSIERMLEWNVPLIAAAYAKKADNAGYPIRTKPGVRDFIDPVTRQPRPDGLLLVDGVPTGLMLIRRDCMQAMVTLNTDNWYEEARLEGRKTWDVFRFTVRHNKRVSEDMFFCEQYRSTGGEVWVDPHVKPNHHGDKAYPGDFAAYIQLVKENERRQSKETVGIGDLL